MLSAGTRSYSQFQCLMGVARVPAEHVVLGRVTEFVEPDAVHRVIGVERQVGRGNLVRFHEPQVKFDRAIAEAGCW